MICPKCGQEIIDPKEFCVRCGTRLAKTKEVSRKGLLIFIIIMIMIGIFTCYMVINYNTDKEIKPYIEKK